MNRLILIALAGLLATGCATSTLTTGKYFNTSNVSKIVKGKTTKQEIYNLFGQPFSKFVTSETGEKWTYLYSKTTSKAQSYIYVIKVETTGMRQNLEVLFSNGVVVNHTLSKTINPSVMNIN